MFDEETEALAARASGSRSRSPRPRCAHRLDSKIETTRLADEAGVPSVPNVLGRAVEFEELRALADGAAARRRPGRADAVRRLRADHVLHVAPGRLGRATAASWSSEELKVMRRIDPREAAIEGVVTRHGTLVGPLMTELTGFPELTPYGGGWCGNEVTTRTSSPTSAARRRARLDARPWASGCARRATAATSSSTSSSTSRTGGMYLGELNPRVTGASSMTNVNAVAYGDMPLFLFHLLEFMDVDYEIDVAELNERWARPRHSTPGASSSSRRPTTQVELLTRRAGDGDLADGGRRDDRVRPPGHGLARHRRRDRGVLPAHRRRRAATATRAPTSASSSPAAA